MTDNTVNGYSPFEDTRLRAADPHEEWIHRSISARFFTAVESGAPTEAEREVVRLFAESTRDLAKLIEKFAPAGRDKSIALTELESVLMRANRAIFAAKVDPTEPVGNEPRESHVCTHPIEVESHDCNCYIHRDHDAAQLP